MKRAAITIIMFRNHLQNLSPISKTYNVPGNIFTSIVDTMHAKRITYVPGLKPCTFKSWTDEIMKFDA